VFGYYVEVTRPNLPLVPPDYERRQTLVGAERFVTPTLREHEARVLGAEERLRALEVHLFEVLLDTVAGRHPTLAHTADALATLDALASLAEVARVLKPGGRLMLEFGDGQAQTIREIFEGEKWIVEAIQNDYNQHPRIIVIQPE